MRFFPVCGTGVGRGPGGAKKRSADRGPTVEPRSVRLSWLKQLPFLFEKLPTSQVVILDFIRAGRGGTILDARNRLKRLVGATAGWDPERSAEHAGKHFLKKCLEKVRTDAQR